MIIFEDMPHPLLQKRSTQLIVSLLVLNALLILLTEAIFGAETIKKYLYAFTFVPLATVCLLLFWRPLAPELAIAEGERDKKGGKNDPLGLTISILVWIGLALLSALIVFSAKSAWLQY